MTGPENNDKYDLHQIHPNVRNDLQLLGNKIISEHEAAKSLKTTLPQTASHWDRAKNYSRQHKKDIAMGSGAIALLAVMAGVMWQNSSNKEQEINKDRAYALHEVLTHPIDLAVLGICPEDLRNEAKSMHGDQAAAYRRAADQETTLALPCTNGSVTSLTINLPNAAQTVVTLVDILPATY